MIMKNALCDEALLDYHHLISFGSLPMTHGASQKSEP